MAKPKNTSKRPVSAKKLQRKAKRLLKRSGREFKKQFPNFDKIKELLEQATLLLTKSTEKLQHDGSQKQDTKKSKNNDSNLKLSYKLEQNYEHHVKKFQTTSCSYKTKVSLPSNTENVKMQDAMNTLDSLFSDIIKEISQKCNLDNPKKDRMRILVTSEQLKKPLSTRLVTLDEQKPSLILSEISKVLQSDEEISLDSSFQVEVVAIKMPSGSGYYKVLNYSKHTNLKRSIIKIRNSDNLCCSRALVTGRALALGDPKLKQIKIGRAIQKRLALDLHSKAGVKLGNCDLSDIDKFQNVMPLCQVVVYSFDAKNSIIYEGPERDKKVVLYHHEGHFDVINPKMLSSIFGKRFRCKKCKKSYSNYINHPCNNVCQICKRKICPKGNELIECPDCHRFCRSLSCWEHHKKEKTKTGKTIRSKCQMFFRCLECNAIVDSDRKSQHICGEFNCWTCKKIVSPDHLCYMQKKEPRAPSEKLLFFDFETDQSSGEHIPNFCVAQTFEGKQFVFKGVSALHEFCSFLFEESHRNYTIIAHNSKSFDSLFLMQWLFKNSPTADFRIIRNGQKIMQLHHRDYNIRVIDSLNFFQMKLADLPKAFGLKTALKKGFFPYEFNTKENWRYIGPIPDTKYFDPDSMSSNQREEFFQWHTSLRNKNYVFDFQKEILEYCVNDVAILRESCLRFREIFMNECSVDALEYVTIAAACMAIYRSNFLQPETIAIVPKDLYRGIQKMYSKSSIEWLEFVSFVTKKKIEHGANVGEHSIYDHEKKKTYYVDGFCENSNEIWEYLGCIFHSCPKCTDSETPNVFKKNVTNGIIYQQTKDRENRLRELGYTVHFIFGCEFDSLKKTEEFQSFINSHDIPAPLIPRDSFFGGRTNAVKLIYSCKANEKVKYYDFCSLYPFVNKNKLYPVGHPTIITQDFGDISQYFGLIKCKVLPPSGLYFPVLPVRIRSKLLFPLCKQCAIDECESCTHTVAQRSFSGCWTTIEVLKARSLGYEIFDIQEIWAFEKTSCDLFKDYVNTFLKIKTQASGFPSWVKNDSDKEKFVKDYFEHEGIHLNLEEIEKNPPLRSIAKLSLNNIWGRFGMQTERSESEFVHDAKRFYELFNSSELNVEDLYIINEDILEVIVKKRREFIKEHEATNIYIAVFTTAHARLELYNLLEKLGSRVLYYDTDSVFFTSSPDDDYEPELSDYLGGLTDEIEKNFGKGEYITQFVSTGPKSYSYKVSNGAVKSLIKGFSLNYKNSQLLNMESMEELVKNMNKQQIITLTENKITREKVSRKVVNCQQAKSYQLVYDKRIIIDGGKNTIPFGYMWNPSEEDKDEYGHETTFNLENLKLYSEHYKPCQSNSLGELFRYEDNNGMLSSCDDNNSSIDLMQSSDTEESDNELTFEDITFLDDEEEISQGPSFYRALENQM